MGRIVAVTLLIAVAACAASLPMPPLVSPDGRVPEVDILLLGEQHDAPSHQQLQREVIEALAARGRLAAVALEMAEQGRSTAGLPRDAGEAAVQSALSWSGEAWPWATYRAAVMSAVRAGVPVVGANLARSGMRAAMADAALDGRLPNAALQAQQQAVREGHCNLLPESQIAPMTRVQIARDIAMASVLAQQAVPGKIVVLLAGGGHVEPALGVPQHLPGTLRVQAVTLPAEPAKKDYCEELRNSSQRRIRS